MLPLPDREPVPVYLASRYTQKSLVTELLFRAYLSGIKLNPIIPEPMNAGTQRIIATNSNARPV